MIQTRRTEIMNLLVAYLKLINGQASTFDSAYLYNTDISNNVYRKVRFIQEVNDFPSVYLSAGAEIRNFQSQDLTVAFLPVIIRAYVLSADEAQIQIDKLTEDIEHVIYSIGSHPDSGIMDITITNIVEDEGLAIPNGIAEIELSVIYRLEY